MNAKPARGRVMSGLSGKKKPSGKRAWQPAHERVQMPRLELPWKCLPPLKACTLYERSLRATTATIGHIARANRPDPRCWRRERKMLIRRGALSQLTGAALGQHCVKESAASDEIPRRPCRSTGTRQSPRAPAETPPDQLQARAPDEAPASNRTPFPARPARPTPAPEPGCHRY